MGFGNLGFGEILVILLIILLLFGARRIPEIAGSFGKGIKEFKKSLNDVDRSIRESDREDPATLRAYDRPRSTEPVQSRTADDEVRAEPKRLIP